MVEATETPTVTPSAEPSPAPAPEVTPAPEPKTEELAKKLEEINKRLDDKDRYISELANEKAALEARLQHTQTSQPSVDEGDATVADILETAQINPQEAGQKLNRLIAAETSKVKQEAFAQIQAAIEQISYVNEVKAKNKDLIDLGFEPIISNEVGQALKSGRFKNFKEALDSVVKSVRERVDKIKPTAPASPPAEAIAETGANPSPAPTKAPVQDTPEQEIAKRKASRMAKGL